MDAATISAMCTPMHVVPLPHGANQQHLGTLWLGSFQAGSDPELLRQHHINHLVQVLDVPWLPTHTDLSIIVTRFDIMDVPSADLRSHLEEACARIDKSLKSGKNVLVHCQQGISRSASIVIAYLIKTYHMSYDSAFNHVKKSRACIKPNSGFVRCLQEWETKCLPQLSPPIRRAQTESVSTAAIVPSFQLKLPGPKVGSRSSVR